MHIQLLPEIVGWLFSAASTQMPTHNGIYLERVNQQEAKKREQEDNVRKPLMDSYHSSPTPWCLFLSGTLLHEIESPGYYDNSLEFSHPVTSPTRDLRKHNRTRAVRT